jgi:hypothetical protein
MQSRGKILRIHLGRNKQSNKYSDEAFFARHGCLRRVSGLAVSLLWGFHTNSLIKVVDNTATRLLEEGTVCCWRKHKS